MMPSHLLSGENAKSRHGKAGKPGSEKHEISKHSRHPLSVMPLPRAVKHKGAMRKRPLPVKGA